MQVAEIDNYVAVWNFGTRNGGGAAQPARVFFHGFPERVELLQRDRGQPVDAVITGFEVEAGATDKWHVTFRG